MGANGPGSTAGSRKLEIMLAEGSAEMGVSRRGHSISPERRRDTQPAPATQVEAPTALPLLLGESQPSAFAFSWGRRRGGLRITSSYPAPR